MSIFRRRPKRFTIWITYRSGTQYAVNCTQFRVEFDESLGECTSLVIEDMDNSRFSIPKFTNLKAIESVWQLP